MTNPQVTRLLGAVKRSRDFLGIVNCSNGVRSEDGQEEGEHFANLLCQELGSLIAQTEAELVAESAPPSPTNACIRSAKRVIAALNLPEGGGVAMDWGGEWFWHHEKPFPSTDGTDVWYPYDLPWGSVGKTAIGPWPGDWKTSWITATTEEV